MSDRILRRIVPPGESLDCPSCCCPLFGGETFFQAERLTPAGYVVASGCSPECAADSLAAELDRSEILEYRAAFEVTR